MVISLESALKGRNNGHRDSKLLVDDQNVILRL